MVSGSSVVENRTGCRASASGRTTGTLLIYAEGETMMRLRLIGSSWARTSFPFWRRCGVAAVEGPQAKIAGKLFGERLRSADDGASLWPRHSPTSNASATRAQPSGQSAMACSSTPHDLSHLITGSFALLACAADLTPNPLLTRVGFFRLAERRGRFKPRLKG